MMKEREGKIVKEENAKRNTSLKWKKWIDILRAYP
jgi:hypothetical protein